MKKKKLSFFTIAFIVIISFVCGYFSNIGANLIFNRNGLTSKQISVLNTATKIIDEYAIEEHESDFVVDYALKGMAASLNDEYAYYFTKEELNEYVKSTTGTVEGGIGASLYKEEDKLIFAEIYKGLSADAAGLKTGDILTKVNNESINGLSLEEVVNKVKGESGTDVKITVTREQKELSFNVKRTDGQRQLVEYKMVNDFLYVKIISFHGNAVEYFKKALDFGETNNYKGIIMDLRDNPGGELQIFVEIADLLLGEGEIFYAKDKNDNKICVKKSDKESVNKPISVIVNGSSASASEAMAGALRDLGNAHIVGTKTFGKGIMQTNFNLENGGMFKLTTAKYYLPNGDCIHGEGITPEYIVELPQNLSEKFWLITTENDTQLNKAVEVLTK